MTVDEYIALGAGIQAAVVAVIKAAAPKAIVLDRDPVNFDESAWFGALKSDADLAADGKKRVHGWVVTFAGSDGLESSTIRSIEPTFRYRVQVFYGHEFGTNADNSEKRIRAEVLRVQFALASMGRIAGVRTQVLLPIRLQPVRTSQQQVLHRGEGEVSLELQPILTN